ncbi:nucleotide-binding universal stress UspA family protein [Kribbella aluminosa]|uniref:Nucleotide-binding universal stress UspA family protein n=1 Tax=Kribbella aluminosa TaxID=416017 RepID=A0ABS4UG63_9ACTN|nr:universal stress protein [Kribbella aluminosa]MBP2350632.1 nucleotide-binding universal stress UspA family protein [Kribbella aluminosa]
MNYDAEARRTPLPLNRHLGEPAIVVGLDGSGTSWDAFAWAAGEALRTNGRLVAVYVMPYSDPTAALGVPYDYGAAQESRRELADEIEAEADRRAHETGVQLSFVSEFGDAIGTLSGVAREVDARLVVVGRSAKRWHRLTGSLGHRLTCRKDAPVVVVVP